MFLSPRPLDVVIGMITKRESTRRVEEAIANARVPPQDNQVPPLDQVPMGDQLSVNPPPITDGGIRSYFLHLYQAMTSQDNVATSQIQTMMSQVNQEVGPCLPQHASTMSSHLRDFTRMNSPMLFGSKVYEYPQNFLD